MTGRCLLLAGPVLGVCVRLPPPRPLIVVTESQSKQWLKAMEPNHLIVQTGKMGSVPKWKRAQAQSLTFFIL